MLAEHCLRALSATAAAAESDAAAIAAFAADGAIVPGSRLVFCPPMQR